MLAYHDRLTVTQTRLLMFFFMHSKTERSTVRTLMDEGKYPRRSIDILTEKKLLNHMLRVTPEGMKIVNEVGPFAAELAEMFDIGSEAIAMPKVAPPARRHGFGPGSKAIVRQKAGTRKKSPMELAAMKPAKATKAKPKVKAKKPRKVA
jgi:hypothetical protein